FQYARPRAMTLYLCCRTQTNIYILWNVPSIEAWLAIRAGGGLHRTITRTGSSNERGPSWGKRNVKAVSGQRVVGASGARYSKVNPLMATHSGCAPHAFIISLA